jgi:phosphohistidine phosphatase
MMKTLTVVRHAKSSWKDPALRDIERPLNRRGKRDAPEMGARLAARALIPDLMLASPAKRARLTAEAVARELHYPVSDIRLDERIYGADVDGLMNVVWGLDDRFDHVMLFGHNPGLTEFVNTITVARIDNVPTCGVAELQFNVQRWVDCRDATLAAFDYPKRDG